MAKIKYSALVSDMRNSLNGSVMSKNRYGSYLRNKITPVNPQTVAQQNARALFGSISTAWRTLTQAARNSWLNGTQNFPFNDIFGDQKFLSGQTLFVKLNSNLAKLGLPQITTAPVPVGAPSVDFGSLGSVGSTLIFTNPDEIENMPAGATLAMYLTPPVLGGQQFVKNRFRLVQGTAIIAVGGNIEFTPTAGTYESIFGPIGSGEKVFARYAFVNNTTGEQGVPRETVYIKP